MSIDPAPAHADAGHDEPSAPDLAALFHRLNNQLGAGLAHAELIELKSSMSADRSRAGQVISAVLEAMATAQEIRGRLASVEACPD
jgi:hypothetical protein